MISTLMSLKPVLWHTFAIYVFLIFLFRVIGRRQLGQLNVLDLVVIIVMGSAVETSMVAGDTSLPAGLVSAATLLIVNRLMSLLFCRFRRLRHIVQGSPVLLVHDGKFVTEHLKRVGFSEEDVLEALREHEITGVDQVRFAVLEADGEINVIPMKHEGGPTKQAGNTPPGAQPATS